DAFFSIFPPSQFVMIFQECTLTRFSFEKQKSGRRFALFFPFEILKGACNQGGKILDFDSMQSGATPPPRFFSFEISLSFSE
ncbi:hypothetical protein Q4247_19040, partial [Acinetobacter baumannii]